MYTLPPILSRASERSERLARLVYELLDAESDTERLLNGCPTEQEWHAHLGYLRDLQRIGREVLAEHLDA
jgi:hypothetical protein